MTSSDFKKRELFSPGPDVKLIIVHYHLRPGGIRRVIELATPHLVRALAPVETVTLACGETSNGTWLQNFADTIAPAKLETVIAPALGYFSEQTDAPARIRARLRHTLDTILSSAPAENTIVWAHNLGIGRNLLLTQELARACAARNIRLISHHHDWWFDNRWLRWPEIRRSGFSTLKKVAETVFPPSPVIRHAGINKEESAVLKRQFGPKSGWLPNLAEPQKSPRPDRVRAARRWLRQQLGAKSAPVWILPCRLLRRKNIAEALLLTQWLRPEAWLVTTGGASSADELAYFDSLQSAARRHKWRLRLGILQGDETQKPTVPELLAASEAVLLTSIQEGFGLPYLEAAAAGRPLLARNLPNIAPDLHEFGFRFPQSYDETWVSTALFDWGKEFTRQTERFARWRAQLPISLRQLAPRPMLLATSRPPKRIPFSRLTLAAQLEVLAHPAATSWQACAGFNPWLPSWQNRAATGRLQVTRWPRSANRWLSGAAYARSFASLARAVDGAGNKSMSLRVQTELFAKKLCPENLYPLLWATEP